MVFFWLISTSVLVRGQWACMTGAMVPSWEEVEEAFYAVASRA